MASKHPLSPSKHSHKLRINDFSEFPTLSPVAAKSPAPVERPITSPPKWVALFPKRAPRQNQGQTTYPPLPSGTTSLPIEISVLMLEEGPSSAIISPIKADCMSIVSADTIDTKNLSPFDSPTMSALEESVSTIDRKDDKDCESETTATTSKLPESESSNTAKFPDLGSPATSTSYPERLPTYIFPGEGFSPSPIKQYASKLRETPEDHHNTPSYLPGPIPLDQIIATDPHRVVHAIKQMMGNIVRMKADLGCPEPDVESLRQRFESEFAYTERLMEEHKEKEWAANVQMRNTEVPSVSDSKEQERQTMRFNPTAPCFAPSTTPSATHASEAQIPSQFSRTTNPINNKVIDPDETPTHPSHHRRTTSNHIQTRSTISTVTQSNLNIHPLLPPTMQLPPPPAPQPFEQQLPRSVIPSPHQTRNSSNPNLSIQIPGPMGSMCQPQSTYIFTPGSVSVKITNPHHTLSLRQSNAGNHSYHSNSTAMSPIEYARNHYPQRPDSHYSHHTGPISFSPLPQPRHTIESRNPTPPSSIMDPSIVQKAVQQIPRIYRHICPSSIGSSTNNFQCPIGGCQLISLCPDFVRGNCECKGWIGEVNSNQKLNTNSNSNCSEATSDSQRYGARPKMRNCELAHILPSCWASNSHYLDRRNGESEREACQRFHCWGSLSEGMIGEGKGNRSAAQENKIKEEWKWRCALDSLRVPHEQGWYGVKQGIMPINADKLPVVRQRKGQVQGQVNTNASLGMDYDSNTKLDRSGMMGADADEYRLGNSHQQPRDLATAVSLANREGVIGGRRHKLTRNNTN